MWRRLEGLLKKAGRTAGQARFGRRPASDVASPATDVELRTGPASPVVFRKCSQYPNLFEFNLEKLDVNLLIYPKTGNDADRDAVLLIVFGCEEILALDEVNEAYVCRKLSQARDMRYAPAQSSFEAVYSRTAQFDAQDIVSACVGGGDLARVSSVAGGGVRLTAAAQRIAAELAFDLNRRA